MKKLSEVGIVNLQYLLRGCITDENEKVLDLDIRVEHSGHNMLWLTYKKPTENEDGVRFAITTAVKHFVEMLETTLDLTSDEHSTDADQAFITYYYEEAAI